MAVSLLKHFFPIKNSVCREAHQWGSELSRVVALPHVPWQGPRPGPYSSPNRALPEPRGVSSRRTGLREADWAGAAMDPALAEGPGGASSAGAWDRLTASEVSSVAEGRYPA